jgi:spore coat polysaccharide biosynthesis predicted glycosyltransferase SpsG
LATPRPSAQLDDAERRRIHEQYRFTLGTFLKKWPIDLIHMHGADFHEYLPPAGVPVLVLDDDGRPAASDADMILNQNLGADAGLYDTPARLLLGPRYALLRGEFDRWQSWRRAGGVERWVLVTFGGSDPDNDTGAAVAALVAAIPPEAGVIALLGPANPHVAVVEEVGAGRVRVVVQPPDVSEVMAGTDVALAAAGTTAWELAFMMVAPVLVATAANQEQNAAGMEAAGAALRADPHDWTGAVAMVAKLIDDGPTRDAIGVAGRSLVDGLGSARVVAAMREHS